MRIDKKLKILTVLTAIAIMTVAIVYAAYWIYSSVISITVSNYTISLSVSATGLNITLS
jgi:cell division protein FtsL